MKKVTHIHIHDAGGFEEGKHPRSENGQFGSGSGGGKKNKTTKAAPQEHEVPSSSSAPKKPASKTARIKQARANLKRYNNKVAATPISMNFGKLQNEYHRGSLRELLVAVRKGGYDPKYVPGLIKSSKERISETNKAAGIKKPKGK